MRGRNRVVALALGAALALSACSGDDGAGATGAAPDDPTSTSTSTPADGGSGDAATAVDLTEADAAVDRFVAAEGLSGAALVVVDRDAGIVHEHYAGDFTAERVSLIASASKVLTAGVLARLDDEGVLDLDAPIGDVVDWAGDHAAVTPAQLLSNSSGLPGLEDGMGVRELLCQYLVTGTLQDCARQVLAARGDDLLEVEPDTEFRYGGAQWQVAGAVAEVASGRSWAELVEATYVEPCRLGTLAYNNHFTQVMDPAGPFTYPAEFGGDPARLTPTDNPNMEGGAYTTPRDYATVLLAHLRGGRCEGGRIMSAAAVERMRTDRIGPAYDGTTFIDELPGYGLGWWVDPDDPSYVEDAGAFGAVPWLDVDRGYGALVLVERRSRDGRRLAAEVRPLVEAAVDELGRARVRRSARG